MMLQYQMLALTQFKLRKRQKMPNSLEYSYVNDWWDILLCVLNHKGKKRRKNSENEKNRGKKYHDRQVTGAANAGHG